MSSPSISSIILHILPFLTAPFRLKLAQSGSSALRRAVLSQFYEKEALMESLRLSLLGSVFQTLHEPPFKVKLRGGGGLPHKRLRSIRKERLAEGLKTWHAVCARLSFLLQPRVDRAWEGSLSDFEALGDKRDLRLYRYSDCWRALHGMKPMGDMPPFFKIVCLLQSGFPESRVMEVAPLNLLRWSEGEREVRGELSDFPEASKFARVTSGFSAREFFSWAHARDRGLVAKAFWTSVQHQWEEETIKECLVAPLHSLGFRPHIDSTYSDDDEAGVVATENGYLYGNMKVYYPVWRRRD
eukprot:Blabericola_migrator_1__1878@NODE_1510_length_4388_cov_32_092803_g992_i0_p1_GENE_NODE_1510_length_4388_cov_32_092803_g992_i0NODE_1510_length_4388_cov_32_092803_g992_i0_p1_ORF_typecomplete_len298_score51_97DUF4558/PF15104_6/0_0077DUF4558/PF15104_6/8_3e03_NODE_1510_length_4388_cov_32_092803_g992_i031924085